MKKVVIALAAVAAASLPANANASRQLHGIVVSKQKAGHVLVVAARNGTAWTINTKSTAARVGSVVTVSAKQRSDGTFAAFRVRTSGRASRARVRGVVIKNVAGTTFLAAGRSVLAVRSRSRSLMSIARSGPAPGTVAMVGLALGQSGSLTATSLTQTGQTSQIVIQATVAAITPATATTLGSLTLTVSGQQLVIALPAGTVLPPSVVVGATVMLTIRLEPTGPIRPDDDDTDDDDTDDEDTDDEDDNDDDE
jgi:hypothetical protein